MSHGNCGDCEHWKDASQDLDSGDFYGQCRINPPVFVLGLPTGQWPRTEHYDGCSKNLPLGQDSPESEAAAAWQAEHPGMCGTCRKPVADCECLPF